MQTLIEALQEALKLLLALDPRLLGTVLLTLRITFSSLALSTLLGLPVGAALGLAGRLPARGLLMAALYTGMGLPPVVVGLFVFVLLSRSGPLGELGWLFTPTAMVFAQTIIALPLVIGLTMAAVGSAHPELRPQLRALGATRWQAVMTVLAETRLGLLAAIAAAYGRIVAEVGAVMLVGGNIEMKTRVLTTAIVLETRKGAFALALALGLILLALTFAANSALLRFGNWNGQPR
ncbi:MAG: ABC transporter permease [Anaerolineales bacterium]|jgi:tungstate transport system permease protein|nr:tungstate transporter permease [Anaerolineaceae bacterium]MDP6225699.1 ABC transporter permease [Anaerolineales bacterium]MDP7643861.1 ABC transporter permease [Anaerolineales bacterium]HJN41532.1 ABC transporter permease [Anaerolineales bacterium]|tara:strand:- start:649 stop:1353 length:705 start_codon:yes stop_codon:yes gene_type:complete